MKTILAISAEDQNIKKLVMDTLGQEVDFSIILRNALEKAVPLHRNDLLFKKCLSMEIATPVKSQKYLLNSFKKLNMKEPENKGFGNSELAGMINDTNDKLPPLQALLINRLFKDLPDKNEYPFEFMETLKTLVKDFSNQVYCLGYEKAARLYDKTTPPFTPNTIL